MEARNLVVVLYHNDPGTAQALMVSLSQHCGPVSLARNYEEVRSTIARHRADVLVLDLEALGRESSRANAIRDLHREFPSLCIVATHRLADDEVWTEAMNQGAADVCEPRNEKVVDAVMRECRHCAAAAA
jgi:DNA-binding NtrC family response regulator